MHAPLDNPITLLGEFCLDPGPLQREPTPGENTVSFPVIYILHALSLAGLGVHESSLREPMDATFWLKEMSQNSIHFVFNLVVLSRFWLKKG